MALIPVTILTGFLGAGKTTLLNRILHEQHGHKIAVIENEFGEENIDNEILVQDSREQIIEMNNGCICCTVRGDLVRILGELRLRREARPGAFDRVIIETTGLADPAPVAQTFFIDDDIGSYYTLDAILTVVDAVHAPAQLDACHEAQEQVGFSDGAAFRIPFELMRVYSPSAEVQGHGPGQKVLVAGKRHVNVKAIEQMGNKAAAKRRMIDSGVPCVPHP